MRRDVRHVAAEVHEGLVADQVLRRRSRWMMLAPGQYLTRNPRFQARRQKSVSSS